MLHSRATRSVGGAALLTIALVACEDAAGIVDLVPAEVEVVSGQQQAAVVGTTLPEPIVVRVVNDEGKPIGGQVVNFRVIKGAGDVFAGAAITTADGVASDRWTLGTSTADSQIVEARAVSPDGAALVFGRFVAHALPDVPAAAVIVSGNQQSAQVGTRLPDSLAVRVTDRYGNPASSAPVTWTVVSGGGAAVSPHANTDTNGVSRAAWTLGASAGEQGARATAGAAQAAFTATANPEPTVLAIHEGQNQAAAPNTAVPIAPAVIVRDAADNAKPGVIVRFAVLDGGGSVSGADAVSDANGIARVGSWTLGPEVGPNGLTATTPSGSNVEFRARAATNLDVVKLSIHEGNQQTGEPGSTVAVAPAVLVRDGDDIKKPGVTVTFAPATGSGTVTGATVVSDAQGIARVGSWTLGPNSGTHSVTASASGAEPVTFGASAVRASSNITLTIAEPTSFVGDTAYVKVFTSSTSQLASVTTFIAGKTAQLSSTGPGVWQGFVDITGTPRDTMTLLIRAVDVAGAVREALRVVSHDRRPRLTIASPLNRAVARPSVTVKASCDDDDPSGCTLVVKHEGAVVFGPAPSPIDVTVSLSSAEGDATRLSVEATDSRNQASSRELTVYVESSTKLQLIGSTAGTVEDVRGARLLAARTEGTIDSIVVWNVETQMLEGVPISDAQHGVKAFLTPNGFAASVYVTGGAHKLHLLRNGVLTTKDIASPSALEAAAGVIVYAALPGAIGQLHRLNVVTNQDTFIAPLDHDFVSLAENGDVVYRSGSKLLWIHNNAAPSIVATDADDQKNMYGLTDGIGVSYLKRPLTSMCCVFPGQVWLFDGASHSQLSSISNHNGPMNALNNGWVAFLKDDVHAVRQVWTRSPTGATRAVSAVNKSATIQAVAPDGSVVFDSDFVRYHATATGAPVRIMSSVGRVVWRDGKFVAIIGNSAFAVNP